VSRSAIDTRTGKPIRRNATIHTFAGTTPYTFAYVADDGRIATQAVGELPILHPAKAFRFISTEESNK
jgi:hypothetical protein